MKKRVLALVMAVAMLFTVVGCGKDNNVDTSSDAGSLVDETSGTNIEEPKKDDTKKEKEKVEKAEKAEKVEAENKVEELDKGAVEERRSDEKKAPDEALIAVDLKVKNANCFVLNNATETLNIKSLKVTNRQTQGDKDTAYVSAVLENDTYLVNADYTLNYSFLPTGGWALDNCERTAYRSSAKNPYYTEASFIDSLNNNLDNVKIANRNHGVDEAGNYYDIIEFTSTLNYKYMDAIVAGTCTMNFVNDAWSSELKINNVTTDWSRVQGSWFGAHDRTGDYFTIDIESITSADSKAKITYGYSTSPWDSSLSSSDFLPNPYNIEFVQSAKTEEIAAVCDKIVILGTELNIPKRIDTMVSLGLNVYHDKGTVTTTSPDYNPANRVYIDRDKGVQLSYNDGSKNDISNNFEGEILLKKVS